MARLQREAADHNAAMGTQMTERFSAPGATLVKLFGRPADESAEFAARARRVRDIGVRTAMAQSVFITALTLVSALALALVYGLGGYFALRGSLEPGAVVALALLLTRLYAPLTALAGARVEVMSALVSFERVFEVLDLKPLIAEKPDARAGPGRARWPSSSTTSASATRPPTRSPSPPWRRSRPSTPGAARRSCTASPSAPNPARRSPWSAPPAPASRPSRNCCPACTTPTRAPCGIGGVDVRDLTADSLRATLGMVTQDGHLFHESVRANLLLARPEADRGRTVGRAAPRPPRRPGRARCPTASTRSSANAATGSPAANASA